MLMTIDPMTMLMTTHTVTKPMTIASSDSEGASRVLQTCWVVAESPLHAFSPQPSSGGGGGGGGGGRRKVKSIAWSIVSGIEALHWHRKQNPKLVLGICGGARKHFLSAERAPKRLKTVVGIFQFFPFYIVFYHSQFHCSSPHLLIVMELLWALSACSRQCVRETPRHCLWAVAAPIFEPVHRGQIFDMSLLGGYLLYTQPASVWSGSILTEKTGCLP